MLGTLHFVRLAAGPWRSGLVNTFAGLINMFGIRLRWFLELWTSCPVFYNPAQHLARLWKAHLVQRGKRGDVLLTIVLDIRRFGDVVGVTNVFQLVSTNCCSSPATMRLYVNSVNRPASLGTRDSCARSGNSSVCLPSCWSATANQLTAPLSCLYTAYTTINEEQT